jgi:NitT/TauT family transport system substrate-binding protein
MLRAKSVIGMAVLTVVLVGLGWYVLRQASSPTSTTPDETIAFGTVANGLFPALVWIAEQEGYFQHAGLDVNIRGLSSAHIALKTMLEEGTLDIVGVAQTPVVFHSFVRSDYAIIATMADSENNHKLLARKDRGIHTPADLRGKVVGVTKGTSGQFFLDMFLLTHGINSAEVETMDLAVGALTPAFVEGRVDAMATWEPHIFHAQRLLGANAFLFDTHNTVRTKFYLVATKYFITQRPEALQRFLHAMRRAEVFIQEHNKAAMDIASRRTKTEGELAAVIWDDLTFRLVLDQSIVDVLETEARWVIKNQFTAKTTVPNYLPFIFVDGLKAVKPRAVTIVGK